jgi:hypothetical protein
MAVTTVMVGTALGINSCIGLVCLLLFSFLRSCSTATAKFYSPRR